MGAFINLSSAGHVHQQQPFAGWALSFSVPKRSRLRDEVIKEKCIFSPEKMWYRKSSESWRKPFQVWESECIFAGFPALSEVENARNLKDDSRSQNNECQISLDLEPDALKLFNSTYNHPSLYSACLLLLIMFFLISSVWVRAQTNSLLPPLLSSILTLETWKLLFVIFKMDQI